MVLKEVLLSEDGVKAVGRGFFSDRGFGQVKEITGGVDLWPGFSQVRHQAVPAQLPRAGYTSTSSTLSLDACCQSYPCPSDVDQLMLVLRRTRPAPQTLHACASGLALLVAPLVAAFVRPKPVPEALTQLLGLQDVRMLSQVWADPREAERAAKAAAKLMRGYQARTGGGWARLACRRLHA